MATSSAPAAAAPASLRPLGVGLAAAGAGLAAVGSVGFTLVEGLTRPDRSTSATANLEAFTQVGGFAAIAVASASAVLLLAGGGLVLADVAAVPAPSAPAAGD
jgi:hypothetical protein